MSASDQVLPTTDAETDMRLHRSRLMVAITAMNPKGLQQVLQSLPPSAQALETEIKAAQAVVELLSRYDQLELTAMAQETRINELQAVVVSLQTQLRQSEMRGQQVRLELANAKESLGPTLKALKAEVSNAREAAEETLERQRRGADRGLREMQSEFARLHRITAEMREAVNGAEGRARGWLAAQQTLEKTQAELQASRVQIGELEGRLSAAAAVSAELASSKQTIRKLESHVTSSEARMQV
ncbi:hypothetical protein Ctob_010290 [Chrysochromulina tobinii]|uniref:Uncharacterized protein n=1 Tax=Chrysochromulina tobinii TaxID=1460289 RepID=A0A0M0K137_9EUKA|nr:hypothetical protein Ctob_010290 [Chrysochromulina tobinii]|eukprot:KOO32591.1 hypothetical protein Ctob_010290 [Chrysochromulina sp. CCMP291]